LRLPARRPGRDFGETILAGEGLVVMISLAGATFAVIDCFISGQITL
jgi:hypothetical protein